jgi:hypothetical protein
MIKNQIPLTREKYLELDHCGDVPQDVTDGLDQEYESSLPPQFRMPVNDEDYELLKPTPEETQARDHNLVQLGCRNTGAARRGPLDVGPRFGLAYAAR